MESIFFRKAYGRGLVSLLFDIDTLIHKFDHQQSGLSSTPNLITDCTTYFLKNAPLTILGNSDLEVMIILSAKFVLPPSRMPFLIDVCLPVFRQTRKDTWFQTQQILPRAPLQGAATWRT